MVFVNKGSTIRDYDQVQISSFDLKYSPKLQNLRFWYKIGKSEIDSTKELRYIIWNHSEKRVLRGVGISVLTKNYLISLEQNKSEREPHPRYMQSILICGSGEEIKNISFDPKYWDIGTNRTDFRENHPMHLHI